MRSKFPKFPAAQQPITRPCRCWGVLETLTSIQPSAEPIIKVRRMFTGMNHNFVRLLIVIVSARLHETRAGVKTKNTRLFRWCLAVSPKMFTFSKARTKPRAVTRSVFRTGMSATMNKATNPILEFLREEVMPNQYGGLFVRRGGGKTLVHVINYHETCMFRWYISPGNFLYYVFPVKVSSKPLSGMHSILNNFR